MTKLLVERLGGLANFGGAGSRVRSLGEIQLDDLSDADQKAVEAMFVSHVKSKPTKSRDVFRYRISRRTSKGVQTIEAPEEAVPNALSRCVKDELI